MNRNYPCRRSYNQCHKDWLDAMAALSGKKDVSRVGMPEQPNEHDIDFMSEKPDEDDVIQNHRDIRGT